MRRAVSSQPSRPWWRRLERLWALRSLIVGAGAVIVALVIGWIVLAFGGSARVAAMLGLAVAWSFTYVANRAWAFDDSDASLGSSGLKFVVMAVATTLVHGQVVAWLTETWSVPFTIAKLLGDVLVVTIPNLIIMRFVVFPKRKA